MDDIKHVFKKNYLLYASYVILDRAIPNVVDGLKPVQRRILWTLFQMDDGKLHKVANVAGQTMALHPHGDGPITDALVNMANKGYLLDMQGNFGCPSTGDPPAAARYIETRLGALAKETLFNPALTEFVPSYDGRAQEPVVLPAKIPLLLMQGTEGIAVGMATKILPHNFCELLEAEIAILENKEFEIYPDFPSGGIMDPSEYNRGLGKVKLRAKITSPDEKTLVITEICHGTTTESVIRSIDEAAKKGKIKIDSINDYTAEKIEIEVKLPRGQYADKIIDQLYAFTDCEVSITTKSLSIKDQLPWEESVDGILKLHVELLKRYLKQELELERDRLLEKMFEKTLEQIFIENRIYMKIENITTYEKIHTTIENSLTPYHKQLGRIPTRENQERLLAIPIRRISRFDINKNQEDISTLGKHLMEVEKQLKNINRFTINYLKKLLKKYGHLFARRTKIKEIKELDKRQIAERMIKIGYDSESGYIGTKISGSQSIECSNLDKLLLLFQDGSYQVINIPSKQYVHTKKDPVIWIGPADKKTIFRVLYRDKTTNYLYIKRFIIKQFILGKEYQFLDDNHVLDFISTQNGEILLLTFKSKGRQKATKLRYEMDEVAIKGVNAKGVRVTSKELKTVKICKNKES